MTKLEELKAAYEAATPGEWKACRSHEEFIGPMFEIDEEDRVYYESRPFTHIHTETETVAAAHDLFEFERTDATFIALAHNLMPQLLEAVDLLKEVNADFGYNRSQEKRLETALRIEQFIHGVWM